MRISVDDNSMVQKAIEMTQVACDVANRGAIVEAASCLNAAQDFAHLACRELSDIPEAQAILAAHAKMSGPANRLM